MLMNLPWLMDIVVQAHVRVCENVAYNCWYWMREGVRTWTVSETVMAEV